MKKEIRIALDEDTAQFLEMARGDQDASSSDFINSLLRQERFRRGFPPYFKKQQAPQPIPAGQGKSTPPRNGLRPVPNPPQPAQ